MEGDTCPQLQLVIVCGMWAVVYPEFEFLASLLRVLFFFVC
jgi:hypothetical protein